MNFVVVDLANYSQLEIWLLSPILITKISASQLRRGRISSKLVNNNNKGKQERKKWYFQVGASNRLIIESTKPINWNQTNQIFVEQTESTELSNENRTNQTDKKSINSVENWNNWLFHHQQQ